MNKNTQQHKKAGIAGRITIALIFLALVAVSAALVVLSVAFTGAGKTYSDDEVVKSGTAVAESCWAEGPLFLDFWEKCELTVNWDNGPTSTENSVYGDFSSDEIGQAHRVDYVAEKISQGSGERQGVLKDTPRPWAWLGYTLIFPFAGFGMLCLIAMIFVLKPPKAGKGKRKGEPGKTPAKQQQHRE